VLALRPGEPVVLALPAPETVIELTRVGESNTYVYDPSKPRTGIDTMLTRYKDKGFTVQGNDALTRVVDPRGRTRFLLTASPVPSTRFLMPFSGGPAQAQGPLARATGLGEPQLSAVRGLLRQVEKMPGGWTSWLTAIAKDKRAEKLRAVSGLTDPRVRLPENITELLANVSAHIPGQPGLNPLAGAGGGKVINAPPEKNVHLDVLFTEAAGDLVAMELTTAELSLPEPCAALDLKDSAYGGNVDWKALDSSRASHRKFMQALKMYQLEKIATAFGTAWSGQPVKPAHKRIRAPDFSVPAARALKSLGFELELNDSTRITAAQIEQQKKGGKP
jgi:hypothetical protein